MGKGGSKGGWSNFVLARASRRSTSQWAGRRDGRSAIIEGLEGRLLLAWGNEPIAIGLDAARQAYPTVTGTGQTIVLLDAGLNTDHSNFAGRLWTGSVNDFRGNGDMTPVHGWNFYDGPTDGTGRIIGDSQIDEQLPNEGGHGTQNASVAVADNHVYTGDGKTYEGIASGAQVIMLRVLHVNSSTFSINDSRSGGVETALRWVIANRARFNIGAVSMSFASGAYTTGSYPFKDEITTLVGQNVLVTAAAGNGGPGASQDPANDDANVLAVGAWDYVTNTVTSNTSTGGANYVDLLAPGVNLPYAGLGTSDYAYASSPQTSIATPQVAALGLLLKQINPSLTPAQLRTIMVNSGVTVPGTSYKRIKVDAAIAYTYANYPPTVPPAPQDNDIVYDASRNVHMAWYDASTHQLYYAKRPVGSSTFDPTEVIDTGAAPSGGSTSTDVGRFVDLQFSNGGVAAVVYYDATNGDLRYAIRGSSGWTVTQIPDTDNAGQYPSLQFNSSDKPWITHYDATTKDLKVTNYMGAGAWGTNVIDSTDDSGKYAKLAKASTGFSTAYTTRKADGTSEVKTSYQDAGGVWHPLVSDTAAGEVRYIGFSGAYPNQSWHLHFFDAAAKKVVIRNSPGVGPYVPQVVNIGADIGSLTLDASGRVVYYNPATNQLIQGTTAIVNGAGRYANMATLAVPHLGAPTTYYDTLVYQDPSGTSLLVSPEQVY